MIEKVRRILKWYKMEFIGQSIAWNTIFCFFWTEHSICLHLLCALEYKWVQMVAYKSKIEWANVTMHTDFISMEEQEKFRSCVSQAVHEFWMISIM